MQNTSIQGNEHGLTIGVHLPNKNKYPTSKTSGLVVYVHEANYTALDSQEIHVQRGKAVYLAVKLVKTNNYPQPYSDCVKHESLLNGVRISQKTTKNLRGPTQLSRSENY